jgi:hypothetical protein
MKRLQSHSAILVAGFTLLMGWGCQTAPVARDSASAPGMLPSGAAVHPYSADGLLIAFAELCRALGYRPINVQIDQSAFPFIVYGKLQGPCDYRDIRDVLQTMPGYAYVGCVTQIRRDGDFTSFALNMIPRQEYARGGGTQDLMARMSMLANTQR